MNTYSCVRNKASAQPQWVLLKIEDGQRSTPMATFNNKAAAQETAAYLNAISLGKWRVHAAASAAPAPRRRRVATPPATYIWPVIEQTSAVGVSGPRWASQAM